jgi:predicted nucleic acid-binding protein
VSFVLDNSVAMTWAFPDEKNDACEELYLQATLYGVEAPELFALEAANTLLLAHKKGRTTVAQLREGFTLLEAMDVVYHRTEPDHTWSALSALAQKHGLTTYDATYLDVAMNTQLPLATLDKNLRHAAEAEGVLVLP